MVDKFPYFQFDPAFYLSGNIQDCTLEEQGLFINICSLWWREKPDQGGLALSKVLRNRLARNNVVPVRGLLGGLEDRGIITIKNDRVDVAFLREQLTQLKEDLERQREFGRKGALARVQNKGALVKNYNSNSNCNKEKENIKEKEVMNNGAVAVLNNLFQMMEAKHQRNHRRNGRWIQLARGSIGSMSSQGISYDRMIKAITWYTDNDFWAVIQNGRDLETHLTGIEQAMQKQAKEESKDVDHWEFLRKLQDRKR